jgi:tetratricopeptide (TPR) repeat protein
LALENYIQAQRLASREKEVQLLNEIYYAAAVLYDTKGDLENAKEYYLRSISNQSKHLSTCYSNLALISMEQDNSSTAIEYFNLAINEYQNAKMRIWRTLFRIQKFGPAL